MYHFPMRLKMLICATLATVAVAFAANAAGTYSGKIVLDKSKLPKGQNAEQQKMINDSLAKVAQMKINLSLKANKTFTITMSGGPMPKASNAEGTWTQSGNKVTMKTTKQDGKSVSGQQGETQNLTLSGDGKTLTLDGASMGMPGKLIFSKK